MFFAGGHGSERGEQGLSVTYTAKTADATLQMGKHEGRRPQRNNGSTS